MRANRNKMEAAEVRRHVAGMTANMHLQLILLAVSILRKRRGKVGRKRRMWVRDIFQQREAQGTGAQLLPTLRSLDREYYFDFMRLTPEQFDHLLSRIGPQIQCQDTNWRCSIDPCDRLAVTLRFLASGETLRSLSFAFRMGRSTVSKIVSTTCCAIWNVLSEDVMRFPTCELEWQKIADGFEEQWNFPHCIGAIDGKHVIVECPINTGSAHYNYKGTFSKVLMAVCDSRYKFIMVDIGNAGSQSDGGIFLRSHFGDGLQRGSFSIPNPKYEEGFGHMPYIFVGDEAFPLTHYMMRPYPRRNKQLTYPQKIFNYRLSRARRVIENAFGILSSRWRVFRRPFKLSEKNIDNVVKATVCLHNYLMCESNRHRYCPAGFVDSEDWNGEVTTGTWRTEGTDVQGLVDTGRLGANLSSRQVMELREKFAEYFCTIGKVPWQDNIVNRV